jgi:hypothetical protein
MERKGLLAQLVGPGIDLETVEGFKEGSVR